MTKKIKTFTINEEIYASLLALFERHSVRISISSFVNVCLTQLHAYLTEMEEMLKKHPSCEVSLSYIIKKMGEGLDNMKIAGPIMVMLGQGLNTQEIFELETLEMWEDDFQGDKLGITGDMYFRLKQGLTLAPSKEFLIDEETGKKFVVMPQQVHRGGMLIELGHAQNEKVLSAREESTGSET